MSDPVLHKAEKVIAPFGDGTANSHCRHFDCTNASQVTQLPDEWAGAWATFKADGGTCYLLVTKNSTATVVVPAAAADGAPAPTNPWPLFNGESEPYALPHIDTGEHIYLARINAGGGPVSLWAYRSSE